MRQALLEHKQALLGVTGHVGNAGWHDLSRIGCRWGISMAVGAYLRVEFLLVAVSLKSAT